MGGRSVNAGMELHLLFEEFFSGKKLVCTLWIMGSKFVKIPVCASVLTGLACFQLSVTPWTVAH